MKSKLPKRQLPATRNALPLERESDPITITHHVKRTVVYREEKRNWAAMIYATLFGLAAVIFALSKLL